MISVDMTKAREIHRNRLRQLRQPLFEQADVAFMRVLELGGDTSSIAAEKQKLRDLPVHPAIEAAEIPEELKLLTPEVLLNVV